MCCQGHSLSLVALATNADAAKLYLAAGFVRDGGVYDRTVAGVGLSWQCWSREPKKDVPPPPSRCVSSVSSGGIPRCWPLLLRQPPQSSSADSASATLQADNTGPDARRRKRKAEDAELEAAEGESSSSDAILPDLQGADAPDPEPLSPQLAAQLFYSEVIAGFFDHFLQLGLEPNTAALAALWELQGKEWDDGDLDL